MPVNTVLITSVVPSNTLMMPLPPHATIPGSFLITVNPKPLGTTGQLYMAVTCTLLPGPAGSTNYRLTLLTVTEWRFIGPNPTQLDFNRNPVTSGLPEYLPFELNNLIASGTTLPAVIQIDAFDAAVPPPNTDTRTVSLAE